MGEIFVRPQTACGWCLAVLACAGLCGCAPAAPTQPRSLVSTASATSPRNPASATQPPGLAATTRAALADAAQRSGLPAAQLAVLSAEAVTWSDGSLGCPQPGLTYTQALVPGLWIRIRAGTDSLDYHASERGALVLCPPGRATDPIPASGRV